MKSTILKILSLIIIIAYSINGKAQVGINTDNSTPDASAILDIKSTDKGLLIPRMTTAQRTAIASPATGLLVFDMDTETFWFKDATAWVELKSGTVSTLADTDGDTKIEVEASADEDSIRIDIAGIEKMVIRNNANGLTMINLPNNNLNTFFGTDAGYSNISGRYNLFHGYQAGYSNTGGYRNIFQGAQAGYSNKGGYRNIFQGAQAGYSNTTGCYNIFQGAQAGYSNTGGYRNIFQGAQAGYSNTTGYFNIFQGHQAGNSNATGNSNIFIGYKSGLNNTTGNNNTFLGLRTGFKNTTGSDNLFQGYEAGYTNTVGQRNIFQGYQTGYLNTSGHSNLFQGYQAGYSNIDGSSNIFIGYQAGYNELNSNRLYIENSNSTTPLIYGEFDNDLVKINGTLELINSTGINTSLALQGLTGVNNVRTWEIETENGGLVDGIELVFKKDGTEQMRLDNTGNLEVKGNLEFGDKNQNVIGVDREMVMVSGKIDENGSVSSGVSTSSYISSATKTGTGSYTINFVSGTFVDEPIVTITAFTASGGGDNRYAIIESISTTQVILKIRNNSGTLKDGPFNFIAIGEQ